MANSDFVFTLTDVDGISISGTTYKVNSGNPIVLDVKSHSMDFEPISSVRNSPAKTYTTTTNYSTLIGDVTVSGIMNKSIKLTCAIWADSNRPQAGYNGTPLTMKLLNDLVTVNHTYYLKDYQGSDTNVQTPIYNLITDGHTGLINEGVIDSRYVSSNGLKVVIKSVGGIKRGTDDIRGRFILFELELIESP